MSIDAAFRHMNERHFGGARLRLESGTPKVVSVQTTATEVLTGNPNRVAWAIVNKSSNPGHLDYGRNVSTTRGFPVAQSGGSIDADYEHDGVTVQAAVFGINETAAGDWYVVAWEIDPEG